MTVGGRWRCVRGPYVVSGRYLALEADRRLVFTWAWDSDPDAVTTVIVTLTPEGAGTHLVLHHSEDGPGENGHETGWALTLERSGGAL